MRATCGACGSGFQVDERHAGKTGACKHCGALITVPTLDEAADPEAPAPTARGQRAPAPTSGRARTSGTATRNKLAPKAEPVEVDDEEPFVPAVNNPVLAIVAPVAAALLGAAVWALLIKSTGYEIGYLAWGIGLAIGFACVLFGGRGIVHAALCGVLALLSIVGGQAWGIELVSFDDYSALDPIFDEIRQDALPWAKVADKNDDLTVAAFMIRRDYSVEVEPEMVPPAAIDEFREMWEPQLELLADRTVTFDEWLEQGGLETYGEYFEIVPLWTRLKEVWGPLDLVFMGLGVITAGGIVMRVRKQAVEADGAA